MFHAETGDPSSSPEKILSLAISASCNNHRFVVFWRPACFSVGGSLRLCWRVVCLAIEDWAILTGRARGDVRNSGGLALTANDQDCAEQLARFFPQARRVRIPVQVTALRGGRTSLREAAVVEFGGPEHAIFLSNLPLEFDDHVRIDTDGEGRPAEASVVGVQYHEGRKAVAVRFLQGPCDWVVTQP
jgi:hypothetical protein